MKKYVSASKNIVNLLDTLQLDIDYSSQLSESDFLAVLNTNSQIVKSSVSSFINNLQLVKKQELSTEGAVDINFKNLFNVPTDKITTFDDSFTFSYSNTSFTITYPQTEVYTDGMFHDVPSGTIDLTQIDSNPANKEFYIYFKFDTENNKYIFYASSGLLGTSAENLYFAKIITGSSGVSNIIYKNTRYFLNGYSISNIKDMLSLVATDSNGFVDSEILPHEFVNKFYTESRTVSASQTVSYNLETLFGSNYTTDKYKASRIQVLVNESGNYVYPHSDISYFKSFDFKTIGFINNGSVSYDVIVTIIL